MTIKIHRVVENSDKLSNVIAVFPKTSVDEKPRRICLRGLVEYHNCENGPTRDNAILSFDDGRWYPVIETVEEIDEFLEEMGMNIVKVLKEEK